MPSSRKRSAGFLILACLLIAVLSPLPATIQVGFPVLARSSTNQNNAYANWTGALTPGDCVSIDANSNFVDSGVAGCGGAGIRTIGASFGSFEAGAAALSGSKTFCVETPFAGTITAVRMIANVSGSVTVGVLTVAHSSWTGTASASDITGGVSPALSAAASYTNTSLSGWTTPVTADTDFCFALTSPTTVAGVSISVKVAAN